MLQVIVKPEGMIPEGMIQDITSIIAIIVVFVGAYLEYKLNQKINTQLGEADYYKVLYNDFLLRKIPKALDRAKNDMCNQFANCQDKHYLNMDGVNEIVQRLLKHSFFTKFDDVDFYSEIEKQATIIEDFCTEIGQEEYDAADAAKQFVKLESHISELYKIILTRNVQGKKKSKK